MDAERQRRADRAADRRAQRREREQTARLVNGLDLQLELRRLWRVARRIEPALAVWALPELTLRRSRQHSHTSGRTWPSRVRGRIHLTTGTLPEDTIYVLAHEVAHSVSYARGHRGHGDIFKAAEAELLAEAGVRHTRR
jgi:hypothetical protein